MEPMIATLNADHIQKHAFTTEISFELALKKLRVFDIKGATIAYENRGHGELVLIENSQ